MTPAVSGELNVSVKDFYQRFLSDPVGTLILAKDDVFWVETSADLLVHI